MNLPDLRSLERPVRCETRRSQLTIPRKLHPLVRFRSRRISRRDILKRKEVTEMRIGSEQAAAAAYCMPAGGFSRNTAPPELSEIQQMRPDPVASRILSKAGRGKAVSRSEIGYIASTRPDQAGLLSKTSAEREALTRRMRKSRSKTEVRMVHLGAVVTAGKTSVSAGEADTRVNQLNDAKIEYMKTREYRKKPELPPRSLKRKPGEEQGTLRPAEKTCSDALHSAARSRR